MNDKNSLISRFCGFIREFFLLLCLLHGLQDGKLVIGDVVKYTEVIEY